ncbi:MAG: magnesium transporter CorA family protein [Actinomycetota bacterium]|nr:magnesium transporter CorA family protein [Actinomycetota bacterium]
MTQDTGTVRSRLWRDGKLEAEGFPFERTSEYLKEEGCLVWVDICDPESADLIALAEELSLDRLAVEDAIGQAERAKASRYATHTFLTVYSVDTSDDPNRDVSESSLSITRVSAFVMHRGIVTVRTGQEFDMDEVVQRWQDNSDLLKYGPGALVHGLLDVIVDAHFEAVQLLDDQIESLEDQLFDDKAISKQVQRLTYRVRKDLVQLRRVVLPMREVINTVLRHRQDLEAPTELDPWFEDLNDHVLRAAEWTESLRDMISTVFETNLSLQDGRLNTVMKKLTAWAAIIAIPTAITGFFGQNVPYPGFGREWGFVLSSSAIIVIALGLYTIFKRRDWL